MSADDLFDDVLNLEEQYYQEGYSEGLKDGTEAGKVEGRSVGLKSGFEKFLEAGRLQGRALVWANRIPTLKDNTTSAVQDNAATALPPLSSANSRLEKNVVTLYGLLEPGTLATRNDDEAVNDVDSRIKGAQGKAKIIDRVVGEKIAVADTTEAAAGPSAKNENIEDVGRIRGVVE